MEAKETEISCKKASDLFNETLTSSLGSGLGSGLGLGLGFLYIYRAQTLRPFSATIKISYGALKGTEALRKLNSPPHVLVFATKVLVGGIKAAKRLNFVKSDAQSANLIIKRLKPYAGALNVVRYARLVPREFRFPGFGFLNAGYKLSKNGLRVLEGFLGIQLDSAVGQGLDSLGVLVKAVFVTREFSRIVCLGINRIVAIACKRNHEIEDEENNYKSPLVSYRFVRSVDYNLGSWVDLYVERLDRHYRCHGCAHLGSLPLYFSISERSLIECRMSGVGNTVVCYFVYTTHWCFDNGVI